jgi:hypothetical protein
MHFPLEIEQRKVSSSGPDRPSGDALALAKRTAAELNDADWKALFEFLRCTKQKIVEEADTTRLDVIFPRGGHVGRRHSGGICRDLSLCERIPF